MKMKTCLHKKLARGGWVGIAIKICCKTNRRESMKMDKRQHGLEIKCTLVTMYFLSLSLSRNKKLGLALASFVQKTNIEILNLSPVGRFSKS